MTQPQLLSGLRYQLDWDSTINDFDGHFVTTMNEKFGTNHKPEDLAEWDWVRTHDQHIVDYMWGSSSFNNKEWNLAIPPKPGAVLAVNRLLDAGAIVDVVTARPKVHKKWLEQWLEQNGIYGRYLTAWCNEEKSGHAHFWSVNAAVDDSPKAVDYLRRVCTTYLVDMPYNQDVATVSAKGFPVIRVPSLWEAVEQIIVGQIIEEVESD
jgi:hypothetical protein